MSDDINAEFEKIVEGTLSTVEAGGFKTFEMMEFIRAASKMSELSTYLTRFVMMHFVMGDDQQMPDEDVFIGINELCTMIDMITQDLLECDCPECGCECEGDGTCDSCVRWDNCECEEDSDMLCDVCIEYKENN